MKRAICFCRRAKSLSMPRGREFGYRDSELRHWQTRRRLFVKIARLVGCRATRFYTGVPEFRRLSEKWRAFWRCAISRDARAMALPSSPRKLRYDRRPLADDIVGREKGIDVRIALDVISRGLRRRMRCGGRFSAKIRTWPKSPPRFAACRRATKNRRIEIACAYPQSEKSANRRGINNTDWIALDRAIYDSCLDARDYFPRAKKAAR